MKHLRNVSALLGLSTVIALTGCSDSSGGSATTTKASNVTEKADQPAAPKTAAEQAAAALAASEKAGADPDNPQGFHQALTPDGKKINVDLRTSDWESPYDSEVPIEKDYTKLPRPTKDGYPVLNGPQVEKLAEENPDLVKFQASSESPEAGRTVPPAPENPEPAVMGPAVVTAEPEVMDLGEVTAGIEQVTGIITLTNTGDKPVKLLDCKSTCGCTAAQSCPRNEFLAAGESRAIEIKVSPGTFGGRDINKVMTFKLENHPDVSVPVNAHVVAYIVTEPTTVNLETSEHKIKLTAIDEEPFKIVRVDPSLIDEFSEEAKVEHEIEFSDEAWDALKRNRRLTFETDHPKMKSVFVSLLNPTPPTPQQDPALIAKQRAERLLLDGAKNGNVSQVREVLDGEVEVDVDVVRDRTGATALILASANGHLDLARMLLERGADVDSADNSGRTALAHAVQCQPKAECNKLEIVYLLLDHHADFTSSDRTGSTPLIWAAGPSGYPEAAIALVEAGANVNVSSILGTPLMLAAWFGTPESVKMLIDRGAEVNTVGGPQGFTALATAAQYSSNPEIITALLAAGADPTIKSGSGTALDIARGRKDDAAKKIVAILEAAMGDKAKAAGAGESGEAGTSGPAANPS